MIEPFRQFEDLAAAIGELPAAPSGYVRVFRGQAQDYPKILPSGLRRPVRSEAIWRSYSMRLGAELVPEWRPNRPSTIEALMVYWLWSDAIAQHYGPGSLFLDVTYSFEIALWFALHNTNTIRMNGTIGDPKEYWHNHPTQVELLRSSPYEGAGFIYVWDLPLWDGKDIPEPGSVIDLQQAPSVISSSPRIRAQQGCLVYCGTDPEQPLDLRPLLIPGTPFRVARPMTGASSLKRRVRDLFPSPAVDEWYERFLCVPMTYSPDVQTSRIERPINVLVFDDPDDPEYSREVAKREFSLPVPLFHRLVAENPPPLSIVLEAPIFYPYPAGDSPQWHEELLGTDIPESCFAHELDPTVSPQLVPLDNVLFEFSPLEYSGWERIWRTNMDRTMLRAVWLKRSEDNWSVCILYETVINKEYGTLPFGFFPIRVDKDSKRWVFGSQKDSGKAIPVNEDPVQSKALFVAFMLLRHLSPKPTAEAFPEFEHSATSRRTVLNPASMIERSVSPSLRALTNTDDEDKIVVRVTGEAARLYRVSSPIRDWYVLRKADNKEEPFVFPTEYLKSMEFKMKESYRDLEVSTIREAAKLF